MIRYGAKVSLLVLSWVPVAITLTEHVVYVGRIEGGSMKPALNPDSSSTWSDVVLVWKRGLRTPGGVKPGDVVFTISPQDPDKILVKRVLGISGDNILTRAPYPRKSCTVPANHVWLEGDNIHSVDSNTFGPISTGLLIGKATRVIFPPSRYGSIPKGGREARISQLRERDNEA